MSESRMVEQRSFVKAMSDKSLQCQMQICADDSIYLIGDEIEAVFEGQSGAIELATAFLVEHGYQHVKEINTLS